MGDSAFGFSAMEYETLCRYRLDACVIVLNNNGITGGAAEWRAEWDRDTVGALQSPVSALAPTNQYEKITEMFGGQVGVGVGAVGVCFLVTLLYAAYVCCLWYTRNSLYQGWRVRTMEELEAALPEALALRGPSVVHVRISPMGKRKKQQFEFDPTGGNAGAGRKPPPPAKL